MCSFISGVVTAVVASIIIGLGKRCIEKPKITFVEPWLEKKWVGQFSKYNFGSTDISVEVVGTGYNFLVYGIDIQNERRKIIPRRAANIQSTVLTVYDAGGEQMTKAREGRWWSREMVEIDNLFVSESDIDIKYRKNQTIPDGVTQGLVLFVENEGNKAKFMFAIDSDRKNRFLNREDYFKGRSPHYITIFISGDNVQEEFVFKISDNNKITQIKQLPF